MSNPLQNFRDLLTDKGLIPSDIEADGKLHRCPTQTRLKGYRITEGNVTG